MGVWYSLTWQYWLAVFTVFSLMFVSFVLGYKASRVADARGRIAAEADVTRLYRTLMDQVAQRERRVSIDEIQLRTEIAAYTQQRAADTPASCRTNGQLRKARIINIRTKDA